MSRPNRVNGFTNHERTRMCEGKRRFSDELTARAAGLITLEQTPDSGYDKMWPYKCPLCGGFHLTKKRKSGVEPIQLQKQEPIAA